MGCNDSQDKFSSVLMNMRLNAEKGSGYMDYFPLSPFPFPLISSSRPSERLSDMT